MPFHPLRQRDFDILNIEGFAPRMSALRAELTPNLLALAQELAPEVSALTGFEMFPTVARHLRRTTNPVTDTWMALSPNKRGYKMSPHFQVGLWPTHLFIQAGVIYEAQAKAMLAERLPAIWEQMVRPLPAQYRVLTDYHQAHGPSVSSVDDAAVREIATRLANPKRGDLMIGVEIDRAAVIGLRKKAFFDLVLQHLETLTPFFKQASQAAVAV